MVRSLPTPASTPAPMPTSADIRRLNVTLARFYFEVLTYVDYRAKACKSPDLTDECGIALTIYIFAGEIVQTNGMSDGLQGVLKNLNIDVGDIQEMISIFGEHLEHAHSEYVPLFHEGVRSPHIRALADQLLAAAEQYSESETLQWFQAYLSTLDHNADTGTDTGTTDN